MGGTRWLKGTHKVRGNCSPYNLVNILTFELCSLVIWRTVNVIPVQKLIENETILIWSNYNSDLRCVGKL